MRLGIDLGGSKIEIIALDQSGTTVLRRRVATPQQDYPAIIATIARLVEEAEGELGQRGSIGIGIPGVESAVTGVIKNANSTCLIGKPLRQDLQTRMRRDVRIANDANCFALSEAIDGAGSNAKLVFGVILGSGVGGGIVIDGSVITGMNRIAGEWGHNCMPGFEAILPDCYCGRKGCIETFLSGPGLARDHAAFTGEQADPANIAARAASGDIACEATLKRYEYRLAHALAQVINIVDPAVIVLGGGLSNLDRLYDAVPRLWGEYVFSDDVATRLVKHRHGDSSGVRGAAWLWE